MGAWQQVVRSRLRRWHSPHWDVTDGYAADDRRLEKILRRVELRMKAGKCKIMVSNNWEDSTVKTAEGTKFVEVVEDFCCLGCYLSRTGNCDKECIRIGKAASVFGRLVNIWKSKNISLAVKIMLYESLVISTLLCDAESCPPWSHKWKKLEAAHHKFQGRLLGITWRDKVRNEPSERKLVQGNWKI